MHHPKPGRPRKIWSRLLARPDKAKQNHTTWGNVHEVFMFLSICCLETVSRSVRSASEHILTREAKVVSLRTSSLSGILVTSAT